MDEVATTDNNELSLTEQDIAFVAAKSQGLNSIDALIQAYPEDEQIQEWALLRDDINGKTRDYAKLMLRKKAHLITRRRPVEVLTQHYKNRIVQMGETALDTLEELMIEGKSEKVRADVAIEVTRHNVGSPDKQEQNNQSTVVVIIGEPPKDIRSQAEIHRNKQQMGMDIDYNQAINEAHERKASQFESAIEAEVIE